MLHPSEQWTAGSLISRQDRVKPELAVRRGMLWRGRPSQPMGDLWSSWDAQQALHQPTNAAKSIRHGDRTSRPDRRHLPSARPVECRCCCLVFLQVRELAGIEPRDELDQDAGQDGSVGEAGRHRPAG